MVMGIRKREKKDMRSSVTVHLPAAHADLIVGILSKELDGADREGKGSQTSVILDILKLFNNAIELEDRQRSQRGRTDRIKAEKNKAEMNGGQDS